MTDDSASFVQIRGVELEIFEQGTGPALLFLHDENGLQTASPFLGSLARHFRVIAPSHPGFGRSSLPDAYDSVGDLAFFYLDLIDAFGLTEVLLAGASFGGWIAAEVAVRCCHRLKGLVLIDPLGIKAGDRETRDIADVFALAPERVAALTYHDPSSAPDPRTMSDEELTRLVQNRASFTLFAWEPYAHNPKLRGRLHRVTVPTLLLWGTSDGIVSPAYGAAYRDAIPGARLELIAAAGHLPHREQPDATAERMLVFAGVTMPR